MDKDKWICKHWTEIDGDEAGSCEYCKAADRPCGCSATYSQCNYPSRFEREMEKCSFCGKLYGDEELKWCAGNMRMKRICKPCRVKAWMDKIHAIITRRKEARTNEI
ncbi:MAG TPA: hypothetical protein ENI23_06410 [bacterium]|nr:hypothetical protein [bacterium]